MEVKKKKELWKQKELCNISCSFKDRPVWRCARDSDYLCLENVHLNWYSVAWETSGPSESKSFKSSKFSKGSLTHNWQQMKHLIFLNIWFLLMNWYYLAFCDIVNELGKLPFFIHNSKIWLGEKNQQWMLN